MKCLTWNRYPLLTHTSSSRRRMNCCSSIGMRFTSAFATSDSVIEGKRRDTSPPNTARPLSNARRSALVDAHHARLNELGFHLSNANGAWTMTAYATAERRGSASVLPRPLQGLPPDGGPLETIEAKKTTSHS